MPTIALPLGLLALAPFVVFGFGAVGHIPETAERMLVALIDYAALILAFSGGVRGCPGSEVRHGGRISEPGHPLFVFSDLLVPCIRRKMRRTSGAGHWGLALLPEAAHVNRRFVAGAAPLVVACVGLIVAQRVSPSVALTVLALGTLATVLTEHRAARWRLAPPRYMWLRWAVSVVALVMMTMVLILRGIGQTIVF